ncbi:HNH endonuclease [Caballeronia sp. LjRoot31]|uniref:HNH endonuclease n=1 Tax=Caballeronia sp. LjRoot31 TaxID=3342324 RepID=UPI003ECCD06C
MSETSKNPSGVPATTGSSSLIVRTPDVPAQTEYGKYRRYLRYDFYYSCAYCRMTEAEAEAVRFTIDHYEPVSARPDLEVTYSNLMYACDECNSRKGDRYPPPDARSDGYRFFRPDTDLFEDHFSAEEMTLSSKSNTGEYTILTLSLNRKFLRRLRELRLRLNACDKYVSEGITALRSLSIDQLHPQMRSRAARWIKEAVEVNQQIMNEIDDVLRAAARSGLIEEQDEDDSPHTVERQKAIKKIEGLYPGRQWRGRGQKSKNQK